MLHHLLSTGFSVTSWLGLILSQQEHHIPNCQRKFHFLMGDYCNVKPWDLNNTSGFYYKKRKVYILESFYLRAQIPNHELPETITFNVQLLASFLRKKLLYLPNDQDSVIQLSLNRSRFSKLTLVRKTGGRRRPDSPWNSPISLLHHLTQSPLPQGLGSYSQGLTTQNPL